MLFARPGAGKTLTYLMTAEDWIAEKVAKRIMMVGPRRVVQNVWRQERSKWEIPLSISIATGDMSKNAIRTAIDVDTNILGVNYEMYLKLLNEDHRCDAVIYDELSLLRNPSGKRQKGARSAPFKLATGGTGSPAPNGLTSLFGMTKAIGIDFGWRSHDRWLREYFYPLDYDQRKWAAFKDTPEKLAEIIRPYTFVLDDPAVDKPTVEQVQIDITLPSRLREMYDRMREESVLSDRDIVAGSAGVLRNKLRQISGGFIYDNRGNPQHIDDWRLDTIVDLVESMNGQQVIIGYEFREQLAMMRKVWPDLRWLGGDSKDDDTTISWWNGGQLDKLAIHPASAGHGLNLQASQADTVIWWQPIDDYELYSQLLARLARRGGASLVYSYEPCAVNTIDGAVMRASKEKAATENNLWKALT